MSLPVLTASKYTTTLPSTKAKVQYRPFLVKEEKILLVAQESEDSTQILQAVKDIIKACTYDKIDPDALTTYDLEYLFLQIRIKSVGETANLTLKCPVENCGKTTPFNLDLSKVNVTQTAILDPKIMLSDEVGVILRPIPISDISQISEKAEDLPKIISLCIDTIFDSESTYARADTTQEEMIRFVESLTRDQAAKIEAYVESLPTLKHELDWECPHCKTKHHIVLKGLKSFFV